MESAEGPEAGKGDEVSLESYIRAAPKAELHLHLEGAVPPATLLSLARKHRVELPAETEEGLARWFRFRGFDHFSRIYGTISECLRDSEDFERVTHDIGAELARQNVRYAEVSVSASRHRVRGVTEETYLSGINHGRERVWRDFGLEMQWIFTIIRRWDDPTLLRPMADYVIETAIDCRDDGVVALGLAGPEAGAPPEPFAPWFDRAHAAGLRSAPHAGEMMGPASVWGALRALGADRIAHGVRAAEDEELVAFLAGQGTALDLCPHSNICLGVYRRLDDHPLPRLVRAGVTVTVNSDDPPMFSTTLSDDAVTLAHPFGLPVETVDEILLNAVRHSFMDAERKVILLDDFRQEMEALKHEHLR